MATVSLFCRAALAIISMARSLRSLIVTVFFSMPAAASTTQLRALVSVDVSQAVSFESSRVKFAEVRPSCVSTDWSPSSAFWIRFFTPCATSEAIAARSPALCCSSATSALLWVVAAVPSKAVPVAE